jgi:hypothetical protein
MFIPFANTKAVEVPDLKLTLVAHCYRTELDCELISHVDGLSFHSWTGGDRVALNPFVTEIERYLHIRQPNANPSTTRESIKLALMSKSGALWQPADLDCLKGSLLTYPAVDELRVVYVRNHGGLQCKTPRQVQSEHRAGLTFLEFFHVLEKCLGQFDK